MKEKILETLLIKVAQRMGMMTKDNYQELAKEIDTLTHEHYMEFIKWKDANVIYHYEDCTYKSPKSSRANLEELYIYWKDNVYKK